MLSVKGHYRDGKITLLEPMPEGVREAELNIIVLPKQESRYSIDTVEKLPACESNGEWQFQSLGLKSFLDTEDDAEVDWENCFGLK